MKKFGHPFRRIRWAIDDCFLERGALPSLACPVVLKIEIDSPTDGRTDGRLDSNDEVFAMMMKRVAHLLLPLTHTVHMAMGVVVVGY
jgi:hypothetical protein